MTMPRHDFMCRLLLCVMLMGCDSAPVLSPAKSDWHIQAVTSEKGVRAWLIEDSSLPMITVSFMFADAGSRRDDTAGLGALTMALLNEGAGSLDGVTFKKKMEELASNWSMGNGRDTIGGEVTMLTDNQDETAALVRLALTKPRFDADAVTRVKEQFFASFKRQKERVRTIASKAFYHNAFDPHPYGAPTDGNEESIAAITPAMMRARMAWLAKDNLIIGMSGAIDQRQATKLLDDLFGDLPNSAPSKDTNSPPPLTTKQIAISHPSPQSQVVFGVPGLPRRHEDYFVLQILNHVLGGGGFSSRLMHTMREERGLVYHVGTWLTELRAAPLVMGSLATSTATAQDAINLLHDQWKNIADNGISQTELDDAKNYLLAALPLRLTSRGRLADFLVTLQYHELGMDYLVKRRELIESVTLEDCARVAQNVFGQSPLLVTVGEDFSPSLSPQP